MTDFRDYGSSASGSCRLTNQASKRLTSELMTLMMSNSPGISAFPTGDDLTQWAGVLNGPADTVYQGLKFKISMDFPETYPFQAPTVKFITPCYHPNVDEHGNICLDILKENWSAVLSVQTILLSIQSLFNEPNNESPLNLRAAQLWPYPEEFKKELLLSYRPF